MAEIKVVITDETGNQSSTSLPASTKDAIPTPTQNAQKNASAKTKTANESKANSNAVSVAAMIGSRAFNYTTSNVGKWTGSSRTQQTVSNVMQVGSLAAMAYVNPYIAAATVAMNIATTAIDASYENKWNQISSKAKLQKAGYNSSGEIVGRKH